jgi:hypothetical protein
MKEDAGVARIREDSGSSFNKLSGSDNVDEEPDGCGVMLGKVFVDVFRVLDVKACCLDKSLVLYFLQDGEVVRRGGG